jgi:hypothetical protein
MAPLSVNVGEIVRKALSDQFRAHGPGLRVVGEVWEERSRQDEKWGEQNHPDGTGDDVRLLADPEQPTYGTLAYQVRNVRQPVRRAPRLAVGPDPPRGGVRGARRARPGRAAPPSSCRSPRSQRAVGRRRSTGATAARAVRTHERPRLPGRAGPPRAQRSPARPHSTPLGSGHRLPVLRRPPAPSRGEQARPGGPPHQPGPAMTGQRYEVLHYRGDVTDDPGAEPGQLLGSRRDRPALRGDRRRVRPGDRPDHGAAAVREPGEHQGRVRRHRAGSARGDRPDVRGQHGRPRRPLPRRDREGRPPLRRPPVHVRLGGGRPRPARRRRLRHQRPAGPVPAAHARRAGPPVHPHPGAREPAQPGRAGEGLRAGRPLPLAVSRVWSSRRSSRRSPPGSSRSRTSSWRTWCCPRATPSASGCTPCSPRPSPRAAPRRRCCRRRRSRSRAVAGREPPAQPAQPGPASARRARLAASPCR